jgi:hypothetical protein
MKAASAQASTAEGDVSIHALRTGDGGEVVMASFQTLRA